MPSCRSSRLGQFVMRFYGVDGKVILGVRGQHI